jgi:type IV pilus assembly protein PilQ
MNTTTNLHGMGHGSRVDDELRLRVVRRRLSALAIFCLFVCLSTPTQAANVLEDIDFISLPGDRVQISLSMADTAEKPTSFTMADPARITLDFPGTDLQVPRKSVAVGIGMVGGISAVEAMGRTRVVLNLVHLVPYEMRLRGNTVYITVEGGRAASGTDEGEPLLATRHGITNIDFRRGDSGEGRVLVRLTDPDAVANIRQEGRLILVDFPGASLPESLSRRLDVTDFATPVKLIDTYPEDGDVRMEITTVSDEFEYLSYQADDLLTVEFRPLTKAQKEALERERFQYTGERLSLNFQDIEVRAVLQLLADFTDLNMVVSDTVQGSITLRLRNVPWDQALDIILKTKGLSKRQDGNVLLVAPTEEIAAREKLELEAQRQIEELAPLRSEFVQINYASANDIAALLSASENRLLSDRGAVTVDDRTNTLLVQDTSAKLAEVRQIVGRLDIPVRQVLIESRIVLANNDFSRELGVRWGVTYVDDKGSTGLLSTTGTANANNQIVTQAQQNIQDTGH